MSKTCSFEGCDKPPRSSKHPYLFLFELMNEEEQAAFIAALETRMASGTEGDSE